MNRYIPMFLACMTLAVLWGCGRGVQPPVHLEEAPEHEKEAAHGGHQASGTHEGEAAHEGEEPASHEGHAHGGEAGDLERPVVDLMADECEHDMKTFLCDECRYEVGFVKVPAAVAEGGLVTEAIVRAMDFRSDMALNGEIAFDDRRIARLGPREAGFVRRVNVVAGDRVRKGDVLIELESPMYAELTSEFLEASSAVQLAQKAVGWQDGLRAKSMTTEREFQEAATALESARIRLQSARLALKAAGLSESDAGRAASAAGVTMSIRAPFDGEVFEVNAVRGAHLDHDTDAVLMGDQDTLWVHVDLYERQIAAISTAMTDLGLPVAVTVDAWPGSVFEGRLDYLGGVMDRTTRTVKARVTINNVEHRLRAGMFATVRPLLGDSSGAVAVPAASLLRDADESFVFVRQEIPGAGDAGDRWYVRRPVKTGRTAAGFVEITEGLEIGQVIAADGAFLLKSDVLRSKMGEGCAH